MKILNLYAGIGGNRKLWEDVEVTSVESDDKIAKVYKDNFPDDEVIVGDAYQYLLENYDKFDVIWASPPCQSHTRMIRSGRNRKPRYPDLRLYELILFLKHNFKGKWIVENVIPYYQPFMNPKKIGRHLFWCNFELKEFFIESPKNFINKGNTIGAEELKEWLGIKYEGNLYYGNNHDPGQVLRNCVHPETGLHILNCALNKIEDQKIKQGILF